MNIEDQVVSIELSKRLKELGVNQDSFFHWCKHGLRDEGCFLDWEGTYPIHATYPAPIKIYSAFSASELGELIPFSIIIDKEVCYCSSMVGYTEHEYRGHIDYHYHDDDMGLDIIKIDFDADTEANARAKMLIYLIENGLIKNIQQEDDGA